ncbi:phosphoribosylglycinamide formyltransferase [Acinetobacter qingfengensis]|uniref:Phosphoribosylglycinamide formyltransferase n=1 Tax=Acinetobacter qingfengensis TaxID=1262585 RepID=A0A1E7RFJ6_9GAMM|nr:phosphoribosylglycinamide formyltransferase [Acinetobacter qingfengensis]KAA8732716.1 phosphoribosylglycinamide formyltransferase [Acinetobacter qingfengensis]OEY98170.1 phosphoribosylglycinamide formyltransferase [Acinetobacter qingfengensis]
MRIAVLVSGNGSNLQALIDAKLSGKIVGVLSNKANAFAIDRAKQANISTAIISHQDFPDRESFDEQMHEQLIAWEVDLVILAGFMRILTSNFVKKWQGKMINIHPSLLPAYKGMHTHQRVLNTGDTLHGCTVHFVTAELDAGQAIAQGSLQVLAHDTAHSLAQKVHHLEHFIYPLVVEWLCSGQLYLKNNTVIFNASPLYRPLCFSNP